MLRSRRPRVRLRQQRAAAAYKPRSSTTQGPQAAASPYPTPPFEPALRGETYNSVVRKCRAWTGASRSSTDGCELRPQVVCELAGIRVRLLHAGLEQRERA